MKMRTPGARLASLFLAAIVAASCGDDPTMPDFADSLGVDLTTMIQTESGLYYKDLVVGTGAPAEVGKKATVGYSGWLANGTLFDSGSFEFTVGVGMVVQGFDEGVLGMKVGGKRTLVMPPNLGYGNKVNGPIPANSTLIFEVELQKVN